MNPREKQNNITGPLLADNYRTQFFVALSRTHASSITNNYHR